jgi:alcohol dehydrogenase
MLGALMAGCAFGVSGASAAHAVQYPVGALTHTAHGDGVGTLLPYVMQYNRPACAPAFAELAKTVGLGSGGEDSDALAQAFVDGLLTDVGIPGSLQELGLHAEDLDAVAEGSLSAARLIKNNPRPP